MNKCIDIEYAETKLQQVLASLKFYNADEFRRELVRIINGATGTNIPDDCHVTHAEPSIALKETL
jgi:hypothetical protein